MSETWFTYNYCGTAWRLSDTWIKLFSWLTNSLTASQNIRTLRNLGSPSSSPIDSKAECRSHARIVCKIWPKRRNISEAAGGVCDSEDFTIFIKFWQIFFTVRGPQNNQQKLILQIKKKSSTPWNGGGGENIADGELKAKLPHSALKDLIGEGEECLVFLLYLIAAMIFARPCSLG